MVPRLRRAFTLTEVVIVLVIIGMLAAIGSLSYAAFTDAATDTVAEGRLDVAHAVELRFATTWGRYSPHLADLSTDSSVVLVTGVADGDEVSLAVGASGSLALATESNDGCVARRYPPLDEGYAPVTVTFSAPCDATAALESGDAPRDPAVSARW